MLKWYIRCAVLWPALAVLFLQGCAVGVIPNSPLPQTAGNAAPQTDDWGDANDPIILLAFSGGGSRATALAYSVLQQLDSLSFGSGQGRVSLGSRIKVISSVSGGSVAAAYYGVAEAGELDRLRTDFLDKDNMATLEWSAANPINLFRLVFGHYTRIEILSDLLNRRIFRGKTFADLDRPGHPVVLLNATDMAAGEIFSFTPQRFDDICSDLSRLPLAVGVASSAAFPIALSPQVIKDYRADGCPLAIPENDWVAKDLKREAPRYLNLEEYKRARYVYALRHQPGAFRDIRYLHLLDGGLSDNQGVHALMDAVITPQGAMNLIDDINLGKRKSIVIITVNARSETPSNLDATADTPGILSVVQSVTGVPIDSATASVNVNLQTLEDELADAGRDAARLPAGASSFAGLRVYGIQIDFDQFHSDQTELRDQVKAIGTTWTLSHDQLETTITAGKTLLTQHPCFQKLLMDLNITDVPIDPAAISFCSMVDVAPGAAAKGPS